MPRSDDDEYDYDVCLSFAGEQRPYVDQVASELVKIGVRVFYDDYENVDLWGKDLYEHLAWIYSRAARYCVLFTSKDYAEKVWTTHERKNAQERAFRENEEYILPVRFDEADVPGLRSTIGYVDATSLTPSELAQRIKKKLGPFRRKNYLPPQPTLLWEAMEATGEEERERIHDIAAAFLASLQRMNSTERQLVAYIFLNCCPVDQYTDPHINLDVLRRDLEIPPAEAIATLKGVRSLGFISSVQGHSDEEDEEDEDEDGLHVTWEDRSDYPDDAAMEFAFEYSTEIAVRMMELCVEHLCTKCMTSLMDRLDFSLLGSPGD